MSDSGSDAPKTAMQIAASLANDIYKDGAQPSVQTIGQALAGIFKAIGHYPRYWGIMSDISLEEKERQFKERLQSKVNSIPEDKKVLPKPNILGPSIQALEYGIFEDHLSEMFSQLIASAMDSRTFDSCHPAFVEIVKQISRNESLILKLMSKSHNYWFLGGKKDFVSMSVCGIGRHHINNPARDHDILGLINERETLSSVDNLVRLKLVEEVEFMAVLGSFNRGGEASLTEKRVMEQIELEGHGYPLLRPTYFGYSFIKTCLPDADLDIGDSW